MDIGVIKIRTGETKLMISYIIPIFNTPKVYLERCFNSILDNNIDNYEVILVDDGSQPYVKSFCDEFISLHKQFKYIYQKNQGVSVARNRGITEAQGKYLTFVDSDDTVDCKVFLLADETSDVDVFIFDMIVYRGKGIKYIKTLDGQEGLLSWKDAILDSVTRKRNNSSCGKLYRTDFLKKNNILFDSNYKTGEDLKFVLELLSKQPKVYYYNKIAYKYMYNPSSSSDRNVKYTNELIHNYVQISKWQIKAVELVKLESHQFNIIKGSIERSVVKSLFNLLSDLSLHKQLNRKTRVLVKNELKKLDYTYREYWGKVNRIRYIIICNDFWLLIYIYALARAIYLKVRK